MRVPTGQGHNAFTDLVRWKDNYYLCYRNASSPMSMDGRIHVLRSPDMKSWQPSGVLDTFGDDRDPHFVAAPDTLYVFFGTWNLVHAKDNGLPDRGCVRSYFASSTDGAKWSKIQGVYEEGWWLWRVRQYNGAFYSAAYTACRPTPPFRETRLVSSTDALNWTTVASITKDRMAGEADFIIEKDGDLRMLSRTGDKDAGAMWITGNINTGDYKFANLGVLVHSPALLETPIGLFVAGRGGQNKNYDTRVWKWDDDTLQTQLTLPSSGDNAYPGFIVDTNSAPTSPAFFISWYSQHEDSPDNKQTKAYSADADGAAVYVGRLVFTRQDGSDE